MKNALPCKLSMIIRLDTITYMSDLEVVLKYKGTNVDDGSMPVEDMIHALQGFSNAYKRVTNLYPVVGENIEHRLKVKAIRQGSCDIVIDIVQNVIQNTPGYVAVLLPLLKDIKPAIETVKTIIDVIKLTKHTKNSKYSIVNKGNNNKITVINLEKGAINVDHNVFELFKNKEIEKDIADIVKPLDEDRVSSASLSVKEQEIEYIEEILYKEKQYFSNNYDEEDLSKTEEIELQGRMVSLNKDNNMGTFKTDNNKSIKYKLAMDNPENEYHHFAHKGFVKVECIGYIDKSLEVKKIDIKSIYPLQIQLI